MHFRDSLAVRKIEMLGPRKVACEKLQASIVTIINVVKGHRPPSQQFKDKCWKLAGIPYSDWEVPGNASIPAASTKLPPKQINFANDPLGSIAQLEQYVNDTMNELATSQALPEDKARQMQRLATTIATIKKLKGESVAEVIVANHPKWIALRDAIIETLERYPDARDAVIERLENMADRESNFRK
jgi:hypothetical protein